MGFINVFVGSDAFVRIENRQLKLSNDKKEISYPLEDLNSVMFDNNFGNISFNAISKLSSENVIVYFCDEKHLPSGYLLPFNSHFKIYNIYKKQVNVKKPVLKNIWKNIVIQKISNQAKVLNIMQIENDIETFLNKVQSGDEGNVEAVVANRYFKLLFKESFNRRDESNAINSALNYGYAIIRGAICRSIVSHGLQPFLGIHHINELNNFNLADDIIEPFRPVVDLYVAENLEIFKNGLNTQTKILLLNLLNIDVRVGKDIQALSYAIEIVVNSFVNCLDSQNANIQLPEILNTKVHEYE